MKLSASPDRTDGPEPEPHHAHITQARKLFRGCGFDLSAMQHPKSDEAMAAFRRYLRVGPQVKLPLPYHYFPNAHMRDNYEVYYGRVEQAQGTA